jgi:ubiquinone/menaquinone biosynthesis C-methylase UbiE
MAVGATAIGVGAVAWRVRGSALVRRLGPRPGERLLGAGAHAGQYAADVAERLWPGGELALVDVPETAADESHRRGLESVTLVGTEEAFPFEDGSFDGAYVAGETDFGELRRLLRPGARVVVADRAQAGAAAAAGLEPRGRGRFTAPHMIAP